MSYVESSNEVREFQFTVVFLQLYLGLRLTLLTLQRT